MSTLIKRFNTILLSLNVLGKKLEIEGLDGFNLTDRDRNALKCVSNYFAGQEDREPSSQETSQRRHIEKSGEFVHARSSVSQLDKMATLIVNGSSSLNTASWKTAIHEELKRASRLQKDFDMAISIAKILVEKQQNFLISNNWMDLQKLTYSEVAEKISNASESTVTRRIKSMRFRLNDREVVGKALICGNDLPKICNHLSQLQSRFPDAGRPTLLGLMGNEGYHLSDGQLGNAMRLLRKFKVRSILEQY